MAQPGSATVWGTGGRVFESRLPDERTKRFSFFFDGILPGVLSHKGTIIADGNLLISLRSNDYCQRQFSNHVSPTKGWLNAVLFG